MRLVLLLTTYFSVLAVSAQIVDSVSIKEINVTANLPVNNKSLIVFYQSSTLTKIDDLLNRMDGVNMIKRGAYALEPQINGFSGGQINLTIDGMKMFGACTDKMDPITSYIEPVNLKNIQVNSGTRSIEHGVNIGGSLNMSLGDVEYNQNDTAFVKLGVGYESNATSKTVDFSGAYANQNSSWGLNGVFRKSENYNTGSGETIDNSQYEKINFHAVFKRKLGVNRQFKADLLFDRAVDVGYPALPMDVSHANALLLGLEYTSNNFKAKIYVNDVIHIMDDSQRDSLYVVTNFYTGRLDSVYMRMDMPGRSSTAGVYLEKIIDINPNNQLKLKLDNYTNRSLAEMTMYMRFKDSNPEVPMYMQTWPEILRNVFGLYVTDTWIVNSALTVKSSLRFDFISDLALNDYLKNQFSILNYNLSNRNENSTRGFNVELNYLMNQQLSTNLNVGWAERGPTHSELFGYYLYNAFDGYDYIGNPLLENEKSLFAELKLKYTNSNLRINFTQNLNLLKDFVYTNNLSIPRMNLYANGIRQYINYPEAIMYNAGLQLMWVPSYNLRVLSNSSYNYGKLILGESIPFVNPFNHFLTVSYILNNNIQLIFENEFASKQTKINLNYGESITPSYFVFNIRGSFDLEIFDSKMNLALGITNLFDEAYYTHLDWAKILRPGRSLEVYLNMDI